MLVEIFYTKELASEIAKQYRVYIYIYIFTIFLDFFLYFHPHRVLNTRHYYLVNELSGSKTC